MTTVLAPDDIAQAPFAAALLRMGAIRPEIVVLCADLSRYTDVLPFAERYPDRFFQVGMAEQNMMGVAGGLAKTGLLPIAVTYGVFATRRAYEQIAMAMATGPSRGIVVAFLPGITTPFSATHQAIDDVAMMRVMPGMCVMDPADATEFEAAVEASLDHPGPVYIRGQRGNVRRLFTEQGFNFEIGAARVLRNGGNIGLIVSGLATQWALEASVELDAADWPHSILHVPTIKPFDVEAVSRFCAGLDVVVTIENHSVVGGLGSAVAETLAENGGGARLVRLGVPDAWPPAGSIDYIRAALGLDASSIARTVLDLR